jgi:predicted TIM-barrel fold metal-dependent hydrolase
MIVDGHVHIGSDVINAYLGGKPQGQSVEELLKKMDENDVEIAVIFACPAPVYYDPESCKNREQRLTPSGRDVYPYCYENDVILNAAKKHPKRLVPYLFVDPHNADNIKDIERLVKSNSKIKGLKFHGWTMHTKTTDLIDSKLMDIAEANNLVVLVHTEASDRWDGYAKKYSDPMQAVELARAYPDVKIIAAHLGKLSTEFLECLAEQKNLYTDCGPFLYEHTSINEAESYKHMDISKYTPSQLLGELDRMFPRKILWSTDEPWTVLSETTYQDEVNVLKELPEPVKHRIAEENISRVLGL